MDFTLDDSAGTIGLNDIVTCLLKFTLDIQPKATDLLKLTLPSELDPSKLFAAFVYLNEETANQPIDTVIDKYQPNIIYLYPFSSGSAADYRIFMYDL